MSKTKMYPTEKFEDPFDFYSSDNDDSSTSSDVPPPPLELPPPLVSASPLPRPYLKKRLVITERPFPQRLPLPLSQEARTMSPTIQTKPPIERLAERERES